MRTDHDQRTRRKIHRKTTSSTGIADTEDVGANPESHEEPGPETGVRPAARPLPDSGRRSEDHVLDALREAATSVGAQLDLQPLGRQILETALRTAGAERGVLLLGKSGSSNLVPIATEGIGYQELEAIERVSRTVLNRARDGQVLWIPHAGNDELYRELPGAAEGTIGPVLSVPLLASGEAVGLIHLDAPAGSAVFSTESTRILEAFAAFAAAALENARAHGDVVAENALLRLRTAPERPFARILTLHPGMQQVLARAELAARLDSPVLIMGEPGTGRTLMARSIHEAGRRGMHPFIVYNCATAIQDRAEHLLFGFRDVQSLGGKTEVSGLFRQADRGTILLNEIRTLEPGLQTKIWALLDSGMMRPVGGRTNVPIDVRVLASTDREIHHDVLGGGFHKELFDRLRVLVLCLPPLRERPQDIPLLTRYFLRRHAAAAGRSEEMAFASNAMDLLQSLPWPGNVRQLETVVRMVLFSVGGRSVDAATLEKILAMSPDAGAWTTAGLAGGPAGPRVRSIAEHEVEAIREALIQTGGNKSRAAELLGVHRNTLMRKVRSMDIPWRTRSR